VYPLNDDDLVNQECGVAQTLPPHLHVSSDTGIVISCGNDSVPNRKLAEPIVEIIELSRAIPHEARVPGHYQKVGPWDFHFPM
jgi:hypothetical protein